MCGARRDARRHDVPRAPVAPLRNEGAAAPISAAARFGKRLPCRHCVHGAARRLRRPGDHGHCVAGGRLVRSLRGEVLHHERRHRGDLHRLRQGRRRRHRLPHRAGRPRRSRRPQGGEAWPAGVVHRLARPRPGAHLCRPTARRGGPGLSHRHGLLRGVASPGRRVRRRHRPGRLRVRGRVCTPSARR